MVENSLLAEVCRHRLQLCNPRAAFVVSIVLLLGVLAAGVVVASDTQQTSTTQEETKLQLEIRKLTLEIERLANSPPWISVFGALVTGVVATLASVWVAWRTRMGALDQLVHEKRMHWYPRLVRATAPLAIYFPGCGKSTEASLTPQDCADIGRRLSRWYFLGGGLLMSKEARDNYFYLARGLTLAAAQKSLRVPTFPEDAPCISKDTLDAYKDKYSSELDCKNIDDWKFATPPDDSDSPPEPHVRFKDFVFLQSLSSTLRTSLAEDLRSRRRAT